jgi:ABC-type transport system substrate-binding protein
MHSVFVSHSHQDNALCDAFVAALQSRGVDVWYDRHDLQVGHLLSTEIQRELQARTVYILLATPASIASYWVETELGAYRELAAHDRTRVIIPVIIAPCELPLLLRAYKWIEAVDVPLETVVDQLAPTIGFPTHAELAAQERARAAAEAAAQRRQAEEERRAERQRVALELARARAERRARVTADLIVTGLVTLELLVVAGFLLSLVFGVLPHTIGLGAGVLAVLLLVALGLVPPVRRRVVREWRDARRGLSAVLSVLLTLAVVVTALFVTKPTTLLPPPPKHLGYDFSYTYHAPTHLGGSITLGMFDSLYTLAPDQLGVGSFDLAFPLWQGCVVQLPDLTLGLDGWKADQCTQVPTVQDGGESPDQKTTTFQIDPRAVWSDGVPITADDFLFAAQLAQDPTISQSYIQLFHWHLSALDAHTIRIQWPTPTADYLFDLAQLTPVPLHVYATGKFAGVYNPETGAYNSTLAQQLVASPSFYGSIPVDNGPFTVQSFSRLQQTVLVKNPRFFSSFFHRPALDQMTLVGAFKNYAAQMLQGQQPSFIQAADDLIAGYRSGVYLLVDGLGPRNLRELGGMPANQVVTSPNPNFLQVGFNQRGVAPNARANGGTSIFTDRTVRQAFTEAFDRCTAVRALLHVSTCADPNLFTDEMVNASFPDYDPTYHLPSYNPANAAKLLDDAGYRVVNGIRRNKDGTTPLQLKLVLSPAAVPSSALAASIQQDWQKNLDVAVSFSPGALYGPDCQSVWCSGAFDVLMSDFNALPDPVGYLTGAYGPFDVQDIPSSHNPGASNGFGIIDPYVEQQDQLGAQTPDAGQRIGVYRALDHYFAHQFYMQVLYVNADVTLTKRTLCNFKKWPAQGMNLWNAADWYVASNCP